MLWCATLLERGSERPDALLFRLRPEFLSDLQLVGRVVTAGHRAMRLTHPSIARVEQVVAERDDVGIVTERVDGSSVREIVERVRRLGKTIPMWFGLEVARRVCEALHHAHTLVDGSGAKSPVYHRALGAEQVLVTTSGAVKVTEFGLAAVTAPGPREERGSEDAKLSSLPDGPRAAAADTKCAARVLFELLTLSRCDAEAPKSDGAEGTVLRPFFRPSQFAPWIPPPVDALMSRALGAHRTDAFADAGELAAALGSALDSIGAVVKDEHVAAFITFIAQAEALLAAARDGEGESPPRRGLASDIPYEELDWDCCVPDAANRGESSLGPWDDLTYPRREGSLPEAGASGWDAAVANIEHIEPDAADVASASPVDGEVPLAAARAIAEFERGLELLRKGDLDGAEAAWSRSRELDPSLRAAEANLKLLRRRRSSPPG